jgi:hypothetical protein
MTHDKEEQSDDEAAHPAPALTVNSPAGSIAAPAVPVETAGDSPRLPVDGGGTPPEPGDSIAATGETHAAASGPDDAE